MSVNHNYNDYNGEIMATLPSAPPPAYQDAVVWPSPAASAPSTMLGARARLDHIIQKYEISGPFASKLDKLSSFRTVFVLDDSGSMSARLDESPLNNGMYKATRWDELKYFAQIGVDIANVFNAGGATNVYFLNRPMAKQVKNWDELYPYLVNEPCGYTPLTKVINTVLAQNTTMNDERKLLVIVVTDGEPTDTFGRVDIDGFWRLLKSRPPNVYTTVVSCTDEHDTMSYLNKWDRRLARFDVVDDFKSERDEIKRVQGKSFSFTFGDYIVKCLLGSVDPQLDNLDEHPIATGSCAIM